MSKRVLLIDYEPRSVERLQGLLSTDYQLAVARDGEEGLAAFSAGPRFDLVLLAGMLPRLASGEVIREIRRKGGATAPPILLMVSGYKGSNPKADAQRVGAFDILVKPFSDEDLRGAVRGAIESTDVGAKTVRIPTISAGAPVAELTASDIFSDVLKEVAAEAPTKPAAPPPASTPPPPPPARPPAPADVDQRLRDTLSDILAPRPTVKASPTGPPRPPEKPGAAPKKFSGDADIDRMISDTLSGIPTAPRPRPPLEKTPPPAVPPRPAPPPAAASAPTPAAPAAPAGPPAVPAPAPAAEKIEPVRVPEGPAVSASGPDRFGQYQILERIASGGMAELYRARRSGVEGFQKIVAIKKILPHLADNEAFITMFADEAKLAAQLNHPNIVHIYDLGKIDGGGYFIAMEHVEGRDLRAILESARELGMSLPVPLAVYVASKVASALDYAHRRRDADGRDLHIVHRDVSPQNILISYEGDIKLCDFGIAKAASKVSQTESGALKGKIQYMSPEQAWGKPIDRRSDLFSLGTVLYELLTEQKLFRGDSDLTVLEKVRAAVAARPSEVNPDVPKPLDAVVLRALAREPDDRYANASDMLRDLESILYSYTPAPGSADLAIFLHRLQAEEAAVAEAKAREAARAVPEAEVEQKPRRAKAAPVARRTGTVTAAPSPEPRSGTAPPAPPATVPAAPRPATAPGVFGSYAARQGEGEGKSRTALFVIIGVAALALAGGITWMATRKGSTAAPAPQPTAPPPTAVPAAVEPTAAPAIDSKKVEEEVQRQIAQKKKEMQKALEAQKKRDEKAAAALAVTEAAAAPQASPVPAPPTAAPAAVEPTEEPTEPPAVATAPAPTRVPVATPVPAPAPEPELKRGDLVGPGPGVVEPQLAGSLKVEYPAIARQQGIRAGRVIVLVLVDEDGKVAQARLQQGVASKSGINEAVIDAVRRARFRPATKNGIPVKMWRPVVVDVKP
ncbi:MAG: TonB family protein [Acidobacteriota bacterium]